jgi:mRNA m6A methyltransferase catalytic subunit
MKIDKIQKEGFIFIWVINAKYLKSIQMMEKWGYTFIDEIAWAKRTINRKLAKGHGYYLQHAKEACLVGVKGNPKFYNKTLFSDVIYDKRREQSQKPLGIYSLIEQFVPNGKYCEIFGRKNNLRDYWVTIGNEL